MTEQHTTDAILADLDRVCAWIKQVYPKYNTVCHQAMLSSIHLEMSTEAREKLKEEQARELTPKLLLAKEVLEIFHLNWNGLFGFLIDRQIWEVNEKETKIATAVNFVSEWNTSTRIFISHSVELASCRRWGVKEIDRRKVSEIMSQNPCPLSCLYPAVKKIQNSSISGAYGGDKITPHTELTKLVKERMDQKTQKALLDFVDQNYPVGIGRNPTLVQ